ncbi:MAG: replication initiation protein [Saprospiraceae bacterium]|nr:replication initiation protein [Saprospiraceae bacterium]
MPYERDKKNQKKATSQKRQVAVQSNALINARYEMTAFQKKILLYIISMIQPDDEDFKQYTINVKDFVSDTDYKSKMLYGKLRQETKALIGKVYEIEEADRLLQISILSEAVYLKGKGIIQVRFTPSLKPYLLQLKQHFTATPLKYILSFKSVHSMRIYEMLHQFKSTGFFVEKVEKLKYRLKIEEKYESYSAFKKYVLVQAQKELQQTDMAFTFKEIKNGRKIDRLEFSIKPLQEIPIEAGQEQLIAKLVTDLRLSPLQAKQIVITVMPADIHRTIYEIKEAQRDGKIITNIGAYSMGVFRNKFQFDA